MGRRTKYDADKHIAELLELSSQGKFIVQICAAWEITKPTYYDWAKRFPDFYDATLLAKEYRCAWWLDEAQKNLQNKKYNAVLYSMCVQQLGMSTRECVVEFDFDKTACLSEQAAQIMTAVAAQKISPTVGASLINSLKAIADIKQAEEIGPRLDEIAQKLSALEERTNPVSVRQIA